MQLHTINAFDQRIGNFIRLIRLRSWWDKMFFNAGAAFIFMENAPDLFDLLKWLCFVVMTSFFLVHAYTFNDVCDAPFDRFVGRESAFFSDQQRKCIALCTALAGSALLLICFPSILSLCFTSLYFFSSYLYSAQPARLKGKGFSGVLIAAFAQRPLLFLIFTSSFGCWDVSVLFLSIWLFFGGILAMIGHQIKDYKADIINGIKTFVVRYNLFISFVVCGIMILFIILSSFMPIIFMGYQNGFILTFGMLILSILIFIQCINGVMSFII